MTNNSLLNKINKNIEKVFQQEIDEMFEYYGGQNAPFEEINRIEMYRDLAMGVIDKFKINTNLKRGVK
tara:strand:+ start:4499 stop:4702 length:204 start_codon:yes stop_codon:yes gene_type:complete